MTAKATNDGRDNFTIACTSCPDFGAETSGQSATVKICAQHDKRFHPLTYQSPGRSRSVRDLPAMIHPVPADGVTGKMQPTARRSREIDGDGRVALPSIRKTNLEMSSK